jgi:hypothetical protein
VQFRRSRIRIDSMRDSVCSDLHSSIDTVWSHTAYLKLTIYLSNHLFVNNSALTDPMTAGLSSAKLIVIKRPLLLEYP